MAARTALKSLWFMGGLSLAAGTATLLDGAGLRQVDAFSTAVDVSAPLYPLADHRPLTWRDKRAAEIAWDFIASQTQPETGLVNSVAWFPSTTLWDQGSYLMALVSAVRLGIISKSEFDTRAVQALTSLSRLELIEGDLPNKVYNTIDLTMTDYADAPRPDGIGWSALDIARLLLALRVLERVAPEHGALVRSTVSTWGLDGMAEKGELIGGTRQDGEMQILQEGRIGYEQYAARAAGMWGLDVSSAMSVNRILDWRQVEGHQIPTDRRTASRYQTINPTVSEPYILMGLEMGFDDHSHVLATQILAAQEERSDRTGLTTVVSEDHVDADPYFVYASVFSNARDWAVVDITGKLHSDLRTQSAKASFAWDALFDTPFTNHAVDRVMGLGKPGKGWYAGIYEKGGNENRALALNTNAVILTALHYKAHGPLWNTRLN